MNIKKIRNKFPMMNNNIVFLDSAALVQKPEEVIKAILEFYTKYSISNRTTDSYLGVQVNKKIEDTREMIANLIGCEKDEIIFNSGSTEGLNYCAAILSDYIKKDDEILLSKYNHSSNMVPWIELAKAKKAKVVFSENIIDDISSKTKIISYAQKNNTFNVDLNLRKIYEKAKKNNAFVVNDAAQAISYETVDSNFCDALVFSSNKFFGPTGLGVLYLSLGILSKAKAKKYGGGAIDYIKSNGTWKAKDSIAKHEPGTPNISAIFGLYEAIKFFNDLDKNDLKEYLEELSSYAYDKLSKFNNIRIHSKKGDHIILFEVKNIPSQDVASYLGHNGIYVRSGFFCAKYLQNIIKKPLIRVSLHIYNNVYDIDKLCNAIKDGGDFIDFL